LAGLDRPDEASGATCAWGRIEPWGCSMGATRGYRRGGECACATHGYFRIWLLNIDGQYLRAGDYVVERGCGGFVY
jgi:hypothetical protein